MATTVGVGDVGGETETIDPSEFDRKQVEISDDESIRVYYHPSRSAIPPMPSVTSIIDGRVDPDKEDSLEGWRNAFDGHNAYSRPWWNDQMSFKGYRGTLGHFAILDQLGDAASESYFHEVGDRNYGYEEYYAEYCLKKWSKKAPSASEDNDQRPPRNNEYDGEHAWDKAMRDVNWAVTEFQEIWDEKGLSKENVIDVDRQSKSDVPREYPEILDVERYVIDTEYGYAGQFDLLYENNDGETVLCDLKMTSGIRMSNKIQLAAYARAIPEDVDKTEVVRLHPDSQEVEVEDNTDWDRSLRGLEHEFLSLTEECHNVRLPEALGTTDLKSALRD